MNRSALLLLFCLAPLTVQAQTIDADDARRLERIDSSLQAVVRMLERQVAQTDAVLAMQQVSLQTVLGLRLGDECEALARGAEGQAHRLTYLTTEIESLEEAERSDQPGQDEEDLRWRTERLEDMKEQVIATRDQLRETEINLAEKRTDHARCVEDLQAWQARLDAYLSRHGS